MRVLIIALVVYGYVGAAEEMWRVDQGDTVQQCIEVSDTSFLAISNTYAMVYSCQGDILKTCAWGGCRITPQSNGRYLVAGDKTILVDSNLDTLWTRDISSSWGVMVDSNNIFICTDDRKKIYKLDGTGNIGDSIVYTEPIGGYLVKADTSFAYLNRLVVDSTNKKHCITEAGASLDTISNTLLDMPYTQWFAYIKFMKLTDDTYMVTATNMDSLYFYWLNHDFTYATNAVYGFKHAGSLTKAAYGDAATDDYIDGGIISIARFIEPIGGAAFNEGEDVVVYNNQGELVHSERISTSVVNSVMNPKIFYHHAQDKVFIFYDNTIKQVYFDLTDVDEMAIFKSENIKIVGCVMVYDVTGAYVGSFPQYNKKLIKAELKNRSNKTGLYLVKDGNGNILKTIIWRW